MADASIIRRLVDTKWSSHGTSADPDDPLVRGFTDFGLSADSKFATDEQLHDLEVWRDDLHLPSNSAFLDSTLLRTVDALLGSNGPDVLTPVTLWELTAFIDAMVCFNRLYCIANPGIDVSHFNQRLGADVMAVIPDPDGGTLRRLAAQAAADGLKDMSNLYKWADLDDACDQELQAVVDGWRAVLGKEFPSSGLFDVDMLDSRLVQMKDPSYTIDPKKGPEPDYDPHSDLSTVLIEGARAAKADFAGDSIHPQLQVLIEATRLPRTRRDRANPPSMGTLTEFASNATYRTYVNQGIANALALPYLPGTLRMPFRRLFVERAAQVQDELVSVALADQIFAQQQPSSQLIMPFFTAAVLRRATTREDIWAQMAHVREQSVAFRRTRADLDRMLERSQVSAQALRVQKAIRDEALKLADLAGAAQQSASVALGVVAQTGIIPLTGVLKIGVDAAQGLSRGGSWARIWRMLFHRHEYFLAQTNTQAVGLINALPQLRELWQMPKIGSYLNRFADATQKMGHVLRS